MSGGGSWRVALRIARRDARRARARTALVAVLIALPVAGGAAADVYWRSSDRDPQDVVVEMLGDAQAIVEEQLTTGVTQTPAGFPVRTDGTDAGQQEVSRAPTEVDALVRGLLPAGDRLLVTSSWSPSEPLRHEEVAVRVTLRDDPVGAAEHRARFRHVAGRPPLSPSEIAITPTLARAAGLAVGDRASVPAAGGGTRQAEVVGIVRPRDEPGRAGSSTVYVTPGMLPVRPSPDGSGWGLTRWIVGPEAVTWEQVRRFNQVGMTVVSRDVLLNPPPDSEVDPAARSDWDGSQVETAAFGAVVAGLIVLQICLMAGPAIAVGARRRQRTLALMAANGAGRADVRRLVHADALVTGVLSGAAGVAVGAACGVALVRWLDATGQEAFPRVDLHLLDLVGIGSVAVVAAVAAGIVPAWQAGRRDVVVALRGAAGPPGVPRRLTAAGGLLIALGAAGLGAATAVGTEVALPAALAVTEIGLLLVVPAVLVGAVRAAAHTPLPIRMALRDAARHRSRTVPAVAAVLTAVAGGVTSLMMASATHDQDLAWWQYAAAPSRVVVDGSPVAGTADRDAGITAAPAAAPDRWATMLARNLPVTGAWASFGRPVLPDGTPVEVVAARPDGCRPSWRDHCVRGDDRLRIGNGAIVADGRALGLLLGEDGGPALRAATEVLNRGGVVVGDARDVAPDGTVLLQVRRQWTDQDDSLAERRRPAVVWGGRFAPTAPVLSREAARDLGLLPTPSSVVAVLSREPDDAERARIETAASAEPAAPSVSIETGPTDDRVWWWLALAAAGLVGLVGTFTAVALALAESRADAATFAAMGASPRTRRLLAGGQALVVAGLGSALGLAAGLLTGWALCRQLVTFPVGTWWQVAERSQLGRVWSLDVPWLPTLAWVVGLPLLTSAAVIVVTRSRLPLTRRIGQ